MKCKIPEISWHNRDPVLSIDIQSNKYNCSNGLYRLASGGTDAHVLIWLLDLNCESGELKLDLAADLSRHQRAVNAVKWSPNGQLLASADDESVIFIWKQKSETEVLNILENTNEQDKETWLTLKVLRGHMEDIYDLSWAPNSLLLASASVDNTAMIWDVYKGKCTTILNDHKGFVQGVAWDPKNQYLATLSTDRFLHIFDLQSKRVVHRVNKSTLPVFNDEKLNECSVRLYHDDTLQTFFRRLSFTPDGKLLITPVGISDNEGVTQPLHMSYIFSRQDFRQPAIVLPSPGQYTVAIDCCPLLFKLRPLTDANPPVVPLPYRMIFAIATRSSVYFYDTQQPQPFAVISNIHYTRLTDISWSSDGRIVVVSSTDGFCSLITFEVGELGEVYDCTAEELLGECKDVTTPITKKDKKLIQKDNVNEKEVVSKPLIFRREPRISSTVNNDKNDNTTKENLNTESIKTQNKNSKIMNVNRVKEKSDDLKYVQNIENSNEAIEYMDIDSKQNDTQTAGIKKIEEIDKCNNFSKTENEIIPAKTTNTTINNDACPVVQQNYTPPCNRAPRRVQLRTISTPKSKKKN